MIAVLSVYTVYFLNHPVLVFYLHVVIFTTVLCGARAWVMLALTHILGSVIRLSDFRMNKYLISSWITRDHLFVKKKPHKTSVADKIDERELPAN